MDSTIVYYAVAAGHKIGIYTNWDECKKNIDEYQNPIYKKFLNSLKRNKRNKSKKRLRG
mgnify:CR=1 FL=1